MYDAFLVSCVSKIVCLEAHMETDMQTDHSSKQHPCQCKSNGQVSEQQFHIVREEVRILVSCFHRHIHTVHCADLDNTHSLLQRMFHSKEESESVERNPMQIPKQTNTVYTEDMSCFEKRPNSSLFQLEKGF